MISFITAFKDFDVFYGAVQRSALYTWKENGVKVYAPDNEPTVKENVARFSNVQLVPEVLTARHFRYQNSSPILKDLLLKSLDMIDQPMVAFINSDILIPSDFAQLIRRVVTKYGTDIFIVVSRFDIDLFFEVDTMEKWRQVYDQTCTVHNDACSSDLFIASKENFRKMARSIPEFVLGRYGWDNWIHFYVHATFTSYNGTHLFKTLHCRHGHQHIEIQEGKPGRYAPSSVHNLTLLRNMQNIYGSSIRINKWPQLEL